MIVNKIETALWSCMHNLSRGGISVPNCCVPHSAIPLFPLGSFTPFSVDQGSVLVFKAGVYFFKCPRLKPQRMDNGLLEAQKNLALDRACCYICPIFTQNPCVITDIYTHTLPTPVFSILFSSPFLQCLKTRKWFSHENTVKGVGEKVEGKSTLSNPSTSNSQRCRILRYCNRYRSRIKVIDVHYKGA